MKWRDAEWFGAQALYAALGLGGLYGAIHVIANNARFMDIMNDLKALDLWVGFIMITAIVVATQRLLGWALPLLASASVLYYVFGNGEQYVRFAPWPGTYGPCQCRADPLCCWDEAATLFAFTEIVEKNSITE